MSHLLATIPPDAYQRRREYGASWRNAEYKNGRSAIMWIITPMGFFSVVRKPGDEAAGMLTVRARVRGDLDAPREQFLPSLGPTQESAVNDYRFRAVAPQADVAAAMARMVEAIDYDNFKDEVARRKGTAWAHQYHNVWVALLPLQREAKQRSRGVRR